MKTSTITLALLFVFTLAPAGCKSDDAGAEGAAPDESARVAKIKSVIDGQTGLLDRLATVGDVIAPAETAAAALEGITGAVGLVDGARAKELDLLGTKVKVWEKLKDGVPGVDTLDKAIEDAKGLAGKAKTLRESVQAVREGAAGFGAAWEKAQQDKTRAAVEDVGNKALAVSAALRKLDGVSQAVGSTLGAVRGKLDTAAMALTAATSVPLVGEHAQPIADAVKGLADKLPGIGFADSVAKLKPDADALARVAEHAGVGATTK